MINYCLCIYRECLQGLGVSRGIVALGPKTETEYEERIPTYKADVLQMPPFGKGRLGSI